MMPDLGRYAVEVSAAYIGSLVMLAALVGWVWWRAAKVRRALDRVEARARRR